MKQQHVFGLVSLMLGLAAASCELLHPVDVLRIGPPIERPPILDSGGLDGWEVSWWHADSPVRTRPIPADDWIDLPVRRESPVIVAFRPRLSACPEPWQARPAGLVIPAEDRGPTSYRTAWIDGFASQILLDSARRGLDPSALNLRRFADTAKDRGSVNPWRLDRRRLLDDLVSGDLWIYSFRLRPSHAVHLDLPEGDWQGEFLPAPGMVVGSGGWEGEMGEGLQRFVRLSDAAVASVSVDEGGDALILLDF